jgi:hypothetical protein
MEIYAYTDAYSTFKPYVYAGTTLNGGVRFDDDAKYCICCCCEYKIIWYSRHAHLKTRKHKDYVNKNN